MAGMDISPSPGNHGSASGNGVSMNSTSTSPGHGSQSLHSGVYVCVSDCVWRAFCAYVGVIGE